MMLNPQTPLFSSAEPSLEVHLLGLVDFDACVVLQERLLSDLSNCEDSRGVLLICEHPPMITIGREGSRTQIAGEPAELAARQMEVRWLNRGGPCLVHAPGQLAIYPLIPLDRRGLGLAAFRERLEDALVDTCGEMRVPAWRHPEEAGVWSRCGQVAHVGVAIRSWLSYHGIFLNACPNLDLLRLVRSPDPFNRVTSLAAQRVRPTALHSVRESLIRRLAARLEYGRYHVYTGHPLLRRTRRMIAYA